MKKKLLVILLLIFLVGCEDITDNNNIDSDFCELYPNHETCKTDEDTTPTNPLDENYENLGKDSSITYENRDIVSDECSHLDNIGEWQPVWCDEFSYTGLPNSDLWAYDIGGNGWGNGESQYYTFEDEDNAYVEDGVLTITAVKETLQSNSYTSARVISKNKGDFLYGKIQVRAQLPSGTGTWPAIWMLPTNWEYGGWPTSGEIDIMEHVGYDANRIHGTIHTGAYNHMLGTQVGKSKMVTTSQSAFHVYEMEWEPASIKLYIDGEQYASFGYDPEDNIDIESFEAWPFDKEFHLLLNLAIGGAWGGVNGIDDSIFPSEFLIDYVRVYQKDYSGMDQENPSDISNLESLKESQSSIFIAWDKATDDVKVKEYEIYVNDTLTAKTTVNGHLLSDLDVSTDYEIKIIAVDFAGNKSPGKTETISTTSPSSIHSRVEAEDYTTSLGIQLESTTDVGGGQNVGYIDTGDYLTYTLEVLQAGTYNVDFRYASESNGVHFDFFKGDTKLDQINDQATGGWQQWATTTSSNFYLEKGVYTFKIEATNSGFNINYFEFKKVD